MDRWYAVFEALPDWQFRVEDVYEHYLLWCFEHDEYPLPRTAIYSTLTVRHKWTRGRSGNYRFFVRPALRAGRAFDKWVSVRVRKVGQSVRWSRALAYADFDAWCRAEEAVVSSPDDFYKRMEKAGFTPHKSNGKRYFLGCCPLVEIEPFSPDKVLAAAFASDDDDFTPIR